SAAFHRLASLVPFSQLGIGPDADEDQNEINDLGIGQCEAAENRNAVLLGYVPERILDCRAQQAVCEHECDVVGSARQYLVNVDPAPDHIADDEGDHTHQQAIQLGGMPENDFISCFGGVVGV